MTNDQPIPGTWPMLSRAGYARLVRLAESRLVGYGAAEDVVSQALLKWQAIPRDRRGQARLEQVIKSESASWRRSEGRRQARELRHAADPTAALGPGGDLMIDLGLMVGELEEVAIRRGIVLTEADRVILAQLLSGESMSAIARQQGENRYQILKVRNKWRLVWHLAVHVDARSALFGQVAPSSRCCD